MGRLKHYILKPDNIDEAVYPGNIGFTEMVEFYTMATPYEEKEMVRIIKKGDWIKFRDFIYKVTGKQLQ